MNLIDPLLRSIAESQHGMFTSSQGHSCGLDSRALVALTNAGVLRHPTRGLYAVSELVDAKDEPWHLHRAAGGRLLYPDAILTGASALLAHGVPIWGIDLLRPRLLRPIDRAAAASGLWVRPIHVGMSSPVASPWGPTVDLATALTQCALDDGGTQAVVSADAVLHSGAVTLAELRQRVEAVTRWPRSSRAAFMLSFCDARRESVGESRLGVHLEAAGIEVDPQVEIRDDSGAFVARVDFRVRGRKVAIEFDGKVKYASGDPAVVWAEKRREDSLRRLGYTVVRIYWSDLEAPARMLAKIRAAMGLQDAVEARTSAP